MSNKEKNGARIVVNIDFKGDIIIDKRDFFTEELFVFGDREEQLKQVKEAILEKTKDLNEIDKIKLTLVFKQLESIMLSMDSEMKQQSTSMDKYTIELYYSPSPQYTSIMKKQKP